MIWNCLVVLSCITACLGSRYQSYYDPEPQRPIIQQYSDGGKQGIDALREYDHGGHRQLHDIHDAHGARDYGAGQNHALRDIAKQAHHSQGAHAAAHASGGQQGHVVKSHDKGFYEREKKYGYEKAYGYERETKSHDKDHKAASHAGGYNHHENKGHYNHGAEALRDLASQGNKHHYGSEAHGKKNILLDIGGNRNRGKDLLSKYNDGQRLNNLHLLHYTPLQRNYLPMVMRKNYPGDVDGSLQRFRYLSGIHGLGGLRGYGLGYGYNPLRYGGSPLNYRINSLNIDGPLDIDEPLNIDEPLDIDSPLSIHEPLNINEPLNIDDPDFRYVDEPLKDIRDPVSNVYFIRP